MTNSTGPQPVMGMSSQGLFGGVFNELADFLPDAIFILDTALIILHVNAAAEKLLGYPAAEMIGRNLNAFLPGTSAKYYYIQTANLLNDAEAAREIGESLFVYGIHQDGRLIPLNLSLTERKWRSQTLVVCVPRDLSKLITAQQALSESEQRYRGMIDSQNTLVVRVDRAGRFVFANQAYCQMFGKRLEELIGGSFAPLVHPDDLPATLAAMQGLEKPPYRISVEQRAMTVKGWRWILWEDSVIQDAAQNYYEIQGVGYDITERKQAEEIAITERDLAIILAQKSTLAEALPLCLDLALKVSGMDCGGIYLVDRRTQNLVLVAQQGLSAAFVDEASVFPADSDRYQFVMRGVPAYMPYSQVPVQQNKHDLDEVLQALAVIPVKFEGQVIACINVASHATDHISDHSREAVENLAIHIGSMIIRFQAQEALSESQNEFKSMFDSLQDFVFVLNDQTEIIQINQKVLQGLGYTREELLGKSVLNVHPLEDRARALQIVQDMLAGLVDTCPLNLLKKDGGVIPVETKVAPGHWGSRDVLIGISRDISERKAAEDLRAQQTRLLEYRQKFEETLTSISTRLISLPSAEMDAEISNVLRQIGEFEQVDRSYVFLVNGQTRRMDNTYEWCAPGVEPQIEKLQDIPFSLFPWWIEKLEKLEEVYIPSVEQLPAEAQAEKEVLRAQSIQSVLVVPMAANHSLVGFLGFDSVSRQRFWSPDSILLIKMVGDILSNALMRRQMENDLRQSETRNRALLSAVPDQIFRIRRDGQFLDYKTSTPDLLLIAPELIIGSSLGNILDPDLTQKAMGCIEQALLTREIQTLEYTLKVDGSSHVFEARFKDSGPDEVTAIVREISERARLEQMKSDFINRATHELRTPIATMLLMVNLLESSPTAVEYEEYWDVLKSELGRERALVEDLLSAGRLESDQLQLHFSTFNIKEFVEQIIHQIELPAREKEIKLELLSGFTAEEDAAWISADEKLLTQVFVNLLSNAIKFTPPGGRVEVDLQRLNAGFEVCIRDNGMGIPSEDLPLLFTRFFRGTNAIENEIQGTGIGLFIVRSILEKHGGKIRVHSELNKGSQFEIWLPEDQDSLT